jgi:hypothetical protein
VLLDSEAAESKRYSPGTTTPSFDPAIESADLAEWRQFIAGFFTAEGTFEVTVNNGDRLLPRATITVRADDWPLLLDLRAASGARLGHRREALAAERKAAAASIAAAASFT